MKISKQKKVICICIILSLINFSCVTPQPPKISPTRLNPIDSRAYTNFLEEKKQYDKLLSLIKRELTAIQLMEIYGRKGIELTPDEKQRIKKYMRSKKSKHPIEDFLNEIGLTPQTEDYDPVGKLFLFDTISDIYTYKLVDFKKAQEYNRKAEQLYNKLQDVNINNKESNFFNKERHLYYFKNYALDIKGYNVDEAILNDVYNFDFEKIGKRVRQRGLFIETKLGRREPAKPELRPIKKQDSINLFEQMESFVNNTEQYDEFEKSFILASYAYESSKQGNDNIYLEKIINYAETALDNELEPDIQTKNMINLLSYWLGSSYLKMNNYGMGIKYMQQFVEGIDTLEKLEDEEEKYKKELVARVTDEEIRAAKRKATIIQVITVIGMFAAAGGMVYSMQSMPNTSGYNSTPSTSPATNLNYMQTFMDLIFDGMHYLAWTEKQYGLKKQELTLKKETVRYLTSYSLKLNRYLDKFEMIDYFLEMGKAHNKSKQMEKAYTLFNEAIKIVERQRSTIFTEEQRISFFSAKQELYDNIIKTLVNLHNYDQAIEFVERSKSRAFVDVLGSADLKLKTKDQTEQYNNTIKTRVELNTILENKNIGTDQVNVVVKKAKKSSNDSERGLSIKSKNPTLELSSLSNVQTISANEIKKLTEPGMAIIEYYFSGDTLFSFLVKDNNLYCHSVSVNYKSIEQNANQWIDTERVIKADKESVKNLYDILIAPLNNQLAGIDELVIIPHKALHYIPFQTLFDGTGFLIERFAISYAPSISVLDIARQKETHNGKNALIMGNPNMDLKFANEEAIEIEKLFDNSTLLLNRQATETFIKDKGMNYDYIHLAAHGKYNETSPLSSVIKLSNDSVNDGLLNASELYSVQLNASLVTLSACESGRTKYRTGDELIGLQRGLMFAGTRSIVSSLWNVNDKATGYLMKQFYSNLSTLPKNKALQNAQIATMKQYPNPYFWAAFNLSGARN